jgi:hypothetical protein
MPSYFVMLVVKGLAHVPMRGPAHSLTASIWSSVIVSVSAGGDGGRKPVRVVRETDKK